MPVMVKALRRTDLPENGVVTFELAGVRCIVADVDGDVAAFAVAGPSAVDVDRAVVADRALRCPRHGWPIDAATGGCSAAERCRYEPLSVEVDGDAIRVALPTP